MDRTDDEKQKLAGITSATRHVRNHVTASMSSQRDSTHYNINHKGRGIAMIFNHDKFESNLKLDPRLGTDKDVESMKSMLSDLGFYVLVYRNNNIPAIKRRVTEIATLNHTDYDCFVMVVLTHGSNNDILYANDTCYSSQILWLPFTADLCPTLAGKPKLFFFQACRGTKFMKPVKIQADPSNNTGYKIPSQADFLFAYASAPDYVSLRNTKTGSWFIQAICKEFKENAYKYDILTLLTFVIQSVAIDHEAYLDEDKPKNGKQKQIPCITTSLTRLVKFTEKVKPKQSAGEDTNHNIQQVNNSKPTSNTGVDTNDRNQPVNNSVEISNNAGSTCNGNLNIEERIEDNGEPGTIQVGDYGSTEFTRGVLFFALTIKK